MVSGSGLLGADPSRLRFAVAFGISLLLHLSLLMLNFGEYGEGLPEFSFPRGDRRAKTPDLHLNLNLHNPPGAAVLTEGLAPHVISPQAPHVANGFEVIIEGVKQSPTPSLPSNNAAHTGTAIPKLLTATGGKTDFNVPESEAVKTLRSPENAEASTEVLPMPSLAVDAKPVKDADNKAHDIAAEMEDKKQAEESVTRKLEQEAQQVLAVKEAEKQEAERQHQLQVAATQAENLRLEEVVRQQVAREKTEREIAHLEFLAEQAKAEQRKAELAVREQKMLHEQEMLEQQERALEELNNAEAEKLKQEQLRMARLQSEKLRQEQLRQEQLARLQDEQKAAQLSAAKPRTGQPGPVANDLDEILGAGSARGEQDMDKLLSGRTTDFDKSGVVRHSAVGSTLPVTEPQIPSGVKHSIFGSKNGDVDLNLYIKSWRQKIERNGRLNYAQSAKDRMHADPIVMVSIRSDGSVESITVLRSSGRPEMDEAVRRIVTVNAPYSVFPPSLARKFDVIDIRQVWIFDESLRVTDEMH